jgi:putative oxidoreductase
MAKNKTISNLLNTTNTNLLSICVLLLRCLIGIYLFIAGASKVAGWFGGFNIDATIQFYTKMGISLPFAYLSCYTEFVGGLLLTIGLFTRPAAFAVMINMLVATIVSLQFGLMGPSSAQTPLFFLIVDIAILIAGPMSISIDKLLVRKFSAKA